MANSRGREDASTQALGEWASDVIPKAVAYARSLLRHSADAEDVVHDVLCRLLRHKEYDLITDGRKILFRSVTNACINRRTRARQLISLDAEYRDDSSLVAAVKSKKAQDPASVAMTGELRRRIQRGLATLPCMQRAALELKSMGHSLSTIAEFIDVTPSNAGVLVHRARKALAAHLRPVLEERSGA